MVSNEKSSSSAGVSKFFSSVTKSVTKPAAGKDVDPWFESQRNDIAILETALEKCIKSVEGITKCQKGKRLSTGNDAI